MTEKEASPPLEHRSKLFVRLCAPEIKEFHVAPWLMTWIGQLHFGRRECQEIDLVISELYNNALDHGLLGLDSSLKSSGFDRYIELRRQKLLTLSAGAIEIEIESSAGNFLQIRISNNPHHRVSGHPPSADEPFGRGILLAESFCENLRYSLAGDEVIALYRPKRTRESDDSHIM